MDLLSQVSAAIDSDEAMEKEARRSELERFNFLAAPFRAYRETLFSDVAKALNFDVRRFAALPGVIQGPFHLGNPLMDDGKSLSVKARDTENFAYSFYIGNAVAPFAFPEHWVQEPDKYIDWSTLDFDITKTKTGSSDYHHFVIARSPEDGKPWHITLSETKYRESYFSEPQQVMLATDSELKDAFIRWLASNLGALKDPFFEAVRKTHPVAVPKPQSPTQPKRPGFLKRLGLT